MSEDLQAGPLAVVGDNVGVVTELVEAVGLRVVAGDPGGIDERATAVIAVGEGAVLELARQGCSRPVLPVAAGDGFPDVPADELQAALGQFRRGEYAVFDARTLEVSVDGEAVETALADVMLVTSEPAHISEYTLSTPAGGTSTFRADGVVIASPVGSHGYARRVGGAVLDPDADGLSVVPVGMFSTTKDHWTLSIPDSGPAVSVGIEREEAPVSLLVDDRTVGEFGPEETLSIRPGEYLALLSLSEIGLSGKKA